MKKIDQIDRPVRLHGNMMVGLSLHYDLSERAIQNGSKGG